MPQPSLLQEIPFRAIPHHSGLYLQYLEGTPGALAFYGRPPRMADVEACARAGSGDVPRAEAARILERQNRRFGSSPDALENAARLGRPGCAAVVTGQQVGLFSGPLYTVYKALTAVRIAAALRERGVPAVPVFWMASEDHDLPEVTRLTLLEGGGLRLRTVDFGETLFGPAAGGARPVGSLVLPGAIRGVIDAFLEPLGGAEHAEELRSRIESAYRPGATLAEAFGALMAELFRDHGLVLFDSQDPEAKRLVAPLFRRALEDAPAIHDALEERDRALRAAGFHMQVSLLEDSTVLFFLENGERKALVCRDGGFGIKNEERVFSREEMLGLAEAEPERFSPNVLLRPVVQDLLFPTAAYVAGPAEIAYFAQTAVLYRAFERPMPVIWPRASFTLLEKEVAERMRAHGLRLEDCFEGKHRLVERILEASRHPAAHAILGSLHGELARGLAETRPGMAAVDPTLGPAVDTAARKMLYHVDSLRTRFVHMEARRHKEIPERAERILNACYPNRTLQERELGVCPFVARHGAGVVGDVMEAADVEAFTHRVLALQD